MSMRNPQIGNISISFLATALQGLVNLGAVVYLAKTFGPGHYGVFTYTWAVIGIASVFTSLGIHTLLTRQLSRAGPRHVPYVLGFGLSLTVFVTIGILVLYLIVVQMVPYFSAYRGLFDLWSLSLLPAGITPRWVFSGLSRAWMATVADLAAASVRLAAVLILVHTAQGVRLAIAITVASQLFGMGSQILWTRRLSSWSFQLVMWNDFKKLLRRAFPLAVTGFVGVLYSGLDMCILNFFRGSSEVGYYAAAYRPIILMTTFSVIYFHLLLPAMSQRVKAAPQTVAAMVQRVTTAVMAVVLPVGVGVDVIAKPVIIATFGARYASSGIILMILIWSWGIGVLRDTFSTTLIAQDREAQYARSVAVGGIFNVVLMLIFTSTGLGGVGVALALGLSQLLLLGLCVVNVHRALPHPIPWHTSWASMVKLLVSSLAMASFVLIVRHSLPVWITIGLGVAIYLAMLWVTQAVIVSDLISVFRPVSDLSSGNTL